MHISPRRTGWIEVICGSMFSGKTEELIRRLRLAKIAKQRVAIFKPALDDRYSDKDIVSHDDRRIESVVVSTAAELFEASEGYKVIGIDEGQFFGLELVEVCEKLANGGSRVIVSGLDQDYCGMPFEPIPQLLAVAEYVTKNLAVCVVCGDPANRSYRTITLENRVIVGADEAYEARCRRCFEPPESDQKQRILPMAPLPHRAKIEGTAGEKGRIGNKQEASMPMELFQQDSVEPRGLNQGSKGPQ